jgi:hypothetical protein
MSSTLAVLLDDTVAAADEALQVLSAPGSVAWLSEADVA